MARKTSKRVATSPACAPLNEMYQAATRVRPTSWDQIQEPFLRAIEAFDVNVAEGRADQGDIRNGKGDFFNDLLALLLENCANLSLHSRGNVPGFIFPKHMLDVTYPATGPIVEFLVEAKTLGLPKHPRNPEQKNLLGRPGSADFPKRIKEAAFKTMDLKAEYSRLQTQLGRAPSSVPGGNLTSWSRAVKPRSYMFCAARVIGKNDLEATVALGHTAAQIMDGVGIYCFSPTTTRPNDPRYEPLAVPADIELSRTLFRACQDLVGLPRDAETLPTDVTETPARKAAEVMEEAGIQPEGDEEDD